MRLRNELGRDATSNAPGLSRVLPSSAAALGPVLALLLLVIPVAPARADDDVVVRVVFEFKDDLLKRQYPDAERPAVEERISQDMATACKARLRHWNFVAATPASLAAELPSALRPALTVWISRNTKYQLFMTLRGPAAAASLPPWPVTVYESGDIAIHGLPDRDQLPLDIVDKFRYQPDAETLLQKFDGDIAKAMQRHVPIALGHRYLYVGTKPPRDEAEAVAVVMLDTALEEYNELRFSQFLIRATFLAPKSGEVKVLATADGQEPPQPHKGVRLSFAAWAEGTAKPDDIGASLGAIRTNKPDRYIQILNDLVSIKCERIYLWEYVPQDALR